MLGKRYVLIVSSLSRGVTQRRIHRIDPRLASSGAVDAKHLSGRRIPDRRLGDEHIWPLSVSTDRIGIVAFRAARLLPQLGRGPAPARDGSDGIFEVYPAAALTRWARQSRGYKRAQPDHFVSRRAILNWLVEEFHVDVTDNRDRLVTTSDMLDALICAVLAREAAEGRLDPIPVADRTAALEEGWIHLPPRRQPPTG